MKLILASASPRRLKLLREAGYEVEVDVSGFDERSVKASEPGNLVQEISRQKALAVAPRHEGSIIVAADTLVSYRGQLLGQQADDKAAEKTLRKLLGASHEVYTGICVIDTATGRLLQDVERSTVHLRQVSGTTLIAYIRSGQYKGKAGAYNIADPEFESFIDRVEGSLTNVMGLPMEKLTAMIRAIRK